MKEQDEQGFKYREVIQSAAISFTVYRTAKERSILWLSTGCLGSNVCRWVGRGGLLGALMGSVGLIWGQQENNYLGSGPVRMGPAEAIYKNRASKAAR